MVLDQQVDNKYASTNEQPADVFTKVLSQKQCQKLLCKLGVVNQFINS